MRPYGVYDLQGSKIPDYAYYDLSDLGFNPNTCEIPSRKCGKSHSILRNSKTLNSIRRIWKKKYRSQTKHYIRKDINDYLTLDKDFE